LLEAARLDPIQSAVRNHICNLADRVTETCSRLTEDDGLKRIKVMLPDGFTPTACCDPVHAEHILTNLLSNAVKYSQNATPITINFANRETHIECVVTNIRSEEHTSELQSRENLVC